MNNKFLKKLCSISIVTLTLSNSIPNIVHAMEKSHTSKITSNIILNSEKDLIPLEYFNPDHPLAIKGSVSDNKCSRNNRCPAAAAIYFVPGVGEVALGVTGAVIVGGVAYEAGSAIYNKVKNYFSISAEKEAEKAKDDIPNKLKKNRDTVDLGKFKRTGKVYTSGRYILERDPVGHLGTNGKAKKWKLKLKNGRRIASLDEDGVVVGK